HLATRNMATTAPTNNQVMMWNNGASQWQPSTISVSNAAGSAKQIQTSDGAGNFVAASTATDFTIDDTNHKLTLSGTSPTGDAFVVPASPLGGGAGAANSLVKLGATDIAGGNVNGTYIGVNQGAATADYENYQVAGVSKYLVDKSGNVTATSFTGNGA